MEERAWLVGRELDVFSEFWFLFKVMEAREHPGKSIAIGEEGHTLQYRRSMRRKRAAFVMADKTGTPVVSLPLTLGMRDVAHALYFWWNA